MPGETGLELLARLPRPLPVPGGGALRRGLSRRGRAGAEAGRHRLRGEAALARAAPHRAAQRARPGRAARGAQRLREELARPGHLVGDSPAMEALRRSSPAWARATRPSSSPARRAPARSAWPGRSTWPPGARGGSWRSTAPPSPPRCWRASCSATSGAPSPGATAREARPLRAGPRRHAVPRRDRATCRWSCRPSCCACWRRRRWSGWAARCPRRGRAHPRRHAPGPRARGAGGPLPAGPLLPPQRASRSRVPPLRERPEDILPLARAFAAELAGPHVPLVLAPGAEAALRAYALARQRPRAAQLHRAPEPAARRRPAHPHARARSPAPRRPGRARAASAGREELPRARGGLRARRSSGRAGGGRQHRRGRAPAPGGPGQPLPAHQGPRPPRTIP